MRELELAHQLRAALGRSHLDTTIRLINQGAAPDTITKSGLTPLRVAIEAQRLDAVRALLDLGADPDANEIVTHAATAGHAAILSALLSAGADPTPALLPTAMLGRWDIVELLIAAGAIPDGEVLYCAVQETDEDMVALLLRSGADPNTYTREHGWTPLHLAARYGYTDTARLLIAAGCDTDALTRSGSTPLEIAIKNRRYDVIDLLDPTRTIADELAAKHGHPRA
ncbi:ankyrin repeat domain-containing protein [Nocardia asteroides]|uniref:ankyrin repeat domain-containing protein n=1 Tax=Nocardia asteroides TaxID=1824 RepID=UPI0037CB72A9